MVRATFADGGPIFNAKNPKHVYPIHDASTNLTSPSVDGVTFQKMPPVSNCDLKQLQSTTASGLIVSFADGSVRIIGNGISPNAFWAAVTPAANDTANLD